MSLPGALRGALSSFLTWEPVLVLALMPFLWFPRPWSGWLLGLIPLIWLTRWLVHGRPSVRTPYDVPVICFLGVLPLTLLPVVDWSLATRKLYTLVVGLALVYALANALSTRRLVVGATYLTTTIVGGGIAIIGLVGTEWAVQKFLPLDPIYSRLPVLVRGVVFAMPQGGIHPNEIGGALTLLLPLALVQVLSQRRPWVLTTNLACVWPDWWPRALVALSRLAVVAGLLLIAGVIVLTQSRSAYAGSAVGVLVVTGWWLFNRSTSQRGRWLSAILIAMLLALIAGVGWRGAVAWANSPGSGLDTLPSRLELWSRALLMIQDFAFTGVGPGQFSLVLHALYPPFLIPAGTYVPHAHNFFLQLALDFGVPSAVAILFLLGGFFAGLWAGYRATRNRELRGLAVGLGAGLAGFLVYGLTDAIALGARGALPLWILLGLAAALARVAAKQP